MKYLIDLGSYEDRDYVVVESDHDISKFLIDQHFDLIADGSRFNTKGARKLTLKKLDLTRKPSPAGQRPTFFMASQDFEKWSAWKKTVQENHISGTGWDSCKDANEHYEHIMVQYRASVGAMKKWRAIWAEYIK